MTTQPKKRKERGYLPIGKDWRLSRDSHNIVLARRETAIEKESGVRYTVWDESYFSTLQNALKWLLERDATAANSMKGFLDILNQRKQEITVLLEQHGVQ